MIPYKLFLDDERNPLQCVSYMKRRVGASCLLYEEFDWVIVRDYDEFVEVVEKGLAEGRWPNVVSFDHDLADIHYNPATWTADFVYKEKTGYDCAKWFVYQWLIRGDLKEPKFLIHSMNPVGSERIKEELKRCRFPQPSKTQTRLIDNKHLQLC